jgi:hypothetical protein
MMSLKKKSTIHKDLKKDNWKNENQNQNTK